MQLNRKKLVDLLNKVQPAVGASNGLQGYQYFVFQGNKVQASNGKMLIESSLKNEDGSEDINLCLNCAVPADSFLTLLSSLGGDTVDITEDADKLLVKCGKIKSNFSIVKNKVWLENLVGDKADWIKAEDFPSLLGGLNYCSQVASKDETCGVLCGTHIKDGKYIYGTDRYRLVIWELEKALSIDGTLPVKFIHFLSKYKDEIVNGYFLTGDRFSVVLKDGTLVVTQVLLGTYPDLDKLFPKADDEYVEIQFTEPFDVKRHSEFLSNIASEDRVTKFEVDGTICKITSIDPNLGVLEEEVGINGNIIKEDGIDAKLINNIGASFHFSVNPLLLQGSTMEKDGIKFYPKDCVILIGSENKKYLVNVIK